MADIRPFAALRPRPGLEQRIAALPYDVVSRSEAEEAVREEPLSFLSIDRAETGFPGRFPRTTRESTGGPRRSFRNGWRTAA